MLLLISNPCCLYPASGNGVPAKYVFKILQLPLRDEKAAEPRDAEDESMLRAHTSQTKPGPNIEAAVSIIVARSVSMLPNVFTRLSVNCGALARGKGAVESELKKKWLLKAMLA